MAKRSFGETPLVLTMGEPAGIGGEIACRAWRQRRDDDQPFFIIDDAERLSLLSQVHRLGVPVREIDHPGDTFSVWPKALPVLSQSLAQKVEPGVPNRENATAVIAAIDTAISFALSGEVAGIVTNPIQKSVLYAGGFSQPGHTEYLAEKTAAKSSPVMLLCVPGLRVALVTIHQPLREAITALTSERIIQTTLTVAAALSLDFGIAQPRLAIAGLNPHAGENGTLGEEDNDIIAPAIEALKARDIDASGPFPADTMFHEEARQQYDAAICMYHDQALIPLKTIDFWNGVNITLGLPIVRTSPDHGTGLDIAGTGNARADSLLAALRTARDIATHRRSSETSKVSRHKAAKK